MITWNKFSYILENIGAQRVYDSTGFCRSLKLEKFGNTIKFIWYVNKCSAEIQCDILLCQFDDISIDGFWPNHYTKNINLILEGESVLIIPLEK